MAIDFSTSNTTRYYSVPDSADFTLPDGDWSVIAPVWFPSGQSTANAYYIISTNNYNVANSFNFYVRATSLELAVTFNLYGELICSGALPTNKWVLVYAARRSGNLYVGYVPLDGSAGAESSSLAITGASNGVGFKIGARNDLLSTRFWQGKIGYAGLVSGYGLTAAAATELANGAPLLTMPFASQIVEVWHGRTSSDSSFAGIIKGHVATKNGASYGTVEDDFLTPYVWTPDHVTRTYTASGDGVLASAGTGTLLATGASAVDGVLASAGTGTVNGVGSSTSAGVASSAGTGTVNGVGSSTSAGVMSSAGTGTLLATGSSVTGSDGVASSAGTSTVSGVGSSLSSGVLLSVGTGTLLATGASTSAGVMVSTGFSTVAGAGPSRSSFLGSVMRVTYTVPILRVTHTVPVIRITRRKLSGLK